MPNCYILKGPLPYYQTKHTRNQQLKTFFKDQSHSSPLFVKTFPSHDNDHSDNSVSSLSVSQQELPVDGQWSIRTRSAQVRQRSEDPGRAYSCQTIKSSNESDIFTYVCLSKITTTMILVVETG